MDPKPPERERVLANLEEVMREADRVRADAQRGMEAARRAHFPERRRRDRRLGPSERGHAPERRASERRR